MKILHHKFYALFMEAILNVICDEMASAVPERDEDGK
jgi:hypothetical protein